jgi:putative SOS response-associated peptidase YedK
MCGRFGASFQYRDIKALWNLQGDFPDFFPRYHIVPSQDVPVIVCNEGRNELRPMRWGLVPSWAQERDASSTDRCIRKLEGRLDS